jgi:hypothetical protein
MVCGNVDGMGRFGVSKGYWIEATLSEGMTAGDPAEGQPGASEDAEANEGDVGVFGAGGEIEALGGAEGVKDRRNDGLVKAVDDTDGERGLRISHITSQRHG